MKIGGKNKIINPYLKDDINHTLFLSDFRSHLNLSSTYAYRITAQLAKAGKLCDIGSGRSKIYVRGEAREE